MGSLIPPQVFNSAQDAGGLRYQLAYGGLASVDEGRQWVMHYGAIGVRTFWSWDRSLAAIVCYRAHE